MSHGDADILASRGHALASNGEWFPWICMVSCARSIVQIPIDSADTQVVDCFTLE
jgi:hypothetical protein